MTEEADNLVLKLLREMRGILDDHGGKLRRIENRLDDLHETAVTAPGLAGHANVRHDSIEKRLDDLIHRVEILEKTH